MGKRTVRCVGLGSALAALLLAAGCNPFAPILFGYYLTGQDMEQRILFKFPDDTKRIAVVCYTPHAARLELGHFDRDLNEQIARHIFDYFDSKRINYKKEVVKASRVHKWQDAHPHWMNLDPGEIGRALGVDYLVYIEMDQLSIFEESSHRTLYKGHANATVNVFRIAPENHELVYTNKSLTIDYPTKDRPIPVDSISFKLFRDRMVEHMAKRLSWVFVPHETGDTFDREPH